MTKTIAPLKLTVASGGGHAASPLLYGLLYEDVLHSGDGGLYAELIQNRAFQGSFQNSEGSIVRTLQFWHSRPNSVLSLDTSTPLLSEALPYHMRVDVAIGATGSAGFSNEGFAGMNITPASRYTASFYLRGIYTGRIDCTFWSNTTNKPLGSTTFTVSQTEYDSWVFYESTFTTIISPAAPDENNTFHVTFDATSTAGRSLHFHMISVFPQTYKNSKNGLRVDLAEGINAISGKFLRFPGGNNMEGPNAPYRWIWDKTIGPVINRPGFPGTWGYFNTDGLGLLEMMQWCFDMNLEPILGVWGGMYLSGEVIAQEDLLPYINEVLNELEFLMGPTSTKYGAHRALLGYTTPFSIKYVEIGNEDYLHNGIPSYVGYRFNMYHDAIKAKYPTLTLISSIDASLFPNPKPSIISDIHLYQSVSDTLKLFHTYDNHPRNRPLLIGEYATIFDSTTRPGDEIEDPTLESATAEAVMFLGLERNSDVVLGSCHGGLIKNLLQPNTHVALMKHSASKIVFSMSYYIAKMFASNCGEETVPTTSDTGFGPLYWSATKNLTGTYFVKIVNFDGARMTPVIVDIPGSRKEVGRLVTYTAPNKESTNTLGNAEGVWAERSVERGSDGFKFTLFGKYVTAVLVVEAKAGNYGTARQ